MLTRSQGVVEDESVFLLAFLAPQDEFSTLELKAPANASEFWVLDISTIEPAGDVADFRPVQRLRMARAAVACTLARVALGAGSRADVPGAGEVRAHECHRAICRCASRGKWVPPSQRCEKRDAHDGDKRDPGGNDTAANGRGVRVALLRWTRVAHQELKPAAASQSARVTVPELPQGVDLDSSKRSL
jgi:hypothetical protein